MTIFCDEVRITQKHQWFSGKIRRCHRRAPSSILGWCMSNHFCIILVTLFILYQQAVLFSNFLFQQNQIQMNNQTKSAIALLQYISNPPNYSQ